MSSSLRRAAAFAGVSSLSLASPALGRAAALPFVAVALAAFAVTDGALFELFARPADREDGRLRGLLSFSLAATGLALLVPVFDMPPAVFAATTLLVGFGNLARQAVRPGAPGDIRAATAFVVGGFAAAAAGQLLVAVLRDGVAPERLPEVAFLAASGALLAALLYAVFVERDDPLVMLSVALLLWLFADLAVEVTWQTIAVAIGVTVVFGYLAWLVDAASVTGLLTGVFLALLAVVLGGYGWFAVLLAFFAVGGLATKYRYEEKQARGVAEPMGGARGTGNVLGNSTAALVALLLYAASPALAVPGAVFLYAYAGSVATALGDTLSSEIGGLFDDPRLVTTLEVVEPGTDGAVTWQGQIAGLAGAGVVAGIAVGLLDAPPSGAAVVVAAGLLGMAADSVLGATVENRLVGNQAVNFLATAVGAVSGGLLAIALGIVAL